MSSDINIKNHIKTKINAKSQKKTTAKVKLSINY